MLDFKPLAENAADELQEALNTLPDNQITDIEAEGLLGQTTCVRGTTC